MKSPAFQFYVRDWLLSRSVQKMTGDEVKAYVFLLCESWLEEPRATLPTSDDDLSVMAKLPLKDWMRVKGRVMANFNLRDNRYVNDKLAGISENQTKFRNWGKLGGNPTLTQSEPKEVNPPVNPTLNPPVKGVSNLASASASASYTAPEVNTNNGVGIEVIDYLNQKAGTNFRPVKSNLDFIYARLKEGATVNDLKSVVDFKCKDWLGKPDSKYLRPETLFNATKFNSYIGLSSQKEVKQSLKDDPFWK